jgi:hypothetical protein
MFCQENTANIKRSNENKRIGIPLANSRQLHRQGIEQVLIFSMHQLIENNWRILKMLFAHFIIEK